MYEWMATDGLEYKLYQQAYNGSGLSDRYRKLGDELTGRDSLKGAKKVRVPTKRYSVGVRRPETS